MSFSCLLCPQSQRAAALAGEVVALEGAVLAAKSAALRASQGTEQHTSQVHRAWSDGFGCMGAWELMGMA